jgi:TonB family protein
MSAVAEDLLVSTVATQRRSPRYSLDVSVEVTAWRSGIPYLIPGRALNAGQNGICAALAGDVRIGESVGLQLKLPEISGILSLKAVVRHHSLLLCGLEFQHLQEEQELKLRYWAQTNTAAGREAQLPLFGTQWPIWLQAPALEVHEQSMPPRKSLLRALWGALAVLLITCGLGWWQWYQTWKELESRIEARPTSIHESVPGDVMEKLVTYKITPPYPEAARKAQAHGPVLLDAVIGADGRVVNLHPISGSDELSPAAVDAAKLWHFEPYRVNGRAVPVETTLTVNFNNP